MSADSWGVHRVVEPVGALPQHARRLNNDLSSYEDNEILLKVEALHLDAASFRQLKEAHTSADAIARKIEQIVAERGKQHNPVTGSGGVLLGEVIGIGKGLSTDLELGARVTSLVSLTLVPLSLERVLDVDLRTGKVRVEGRAVLFETAPFAQMPSDLPEDVALAAFDVCGAPAQVRRRVQQGDSVLILGAAGKSGILAAHQAHYRVGEKGSVVGIDAVPGALDELRALELCDHVLQVDARHAVDIHRAALAANGGRPFDIAVSCVNVPGAEMSAILPVRSGGQVYFFSMTTSFTAAALGAEGVGKDVELSIGNGYVPGHAELALSILRERADILELFQRRYAH